MGGVAAQVLARSGVGALTILDKDAFEPSNNNRQCYARTDTWGRAKVEVTQEELLKINPQLQVRAFDHFGADNVDQALDGVHVVINGMDALAACLRLWRRARIHQVPLCDAWTSPLPNVFVIRPGDPLPEERLRYPSVGLEPEALTAEQIAECKDRESLHVALHSRSLRYLDLEVVREILDGRRARISFAPMVWQAGLVRAWEERKLRLGRGEVASGWGRFWDPWLGQVQEARGFFPLELDAALRAWQAVNR